MVDRCTPYPERFMHIGDDRTRDPRQMSAYRDVSESVGKQLVVSTRTRSRASQ